MCVSDAERLQQGPVQPDPALDVCHELDLASEPSSYDLLMDLQVTVRRRGDKVKYWIGVTAGSSPSLAGHKLFAVI